MTIRKDCDVCGEYSAKRDTCLNCKEKFPFKSSGRGLKSFNRKEEFKKSKKKK